MSFNFHPLELSDVVLVRATRHRDARGYFAESYRRSVFAAAGIDGEFVQDNIVHSGARVLRGLHFQRAPRPQGKLVQVLRGRVYDVAVDVRADSPTRGRWVSWELSDQAGESLWIPPGFAHGYQVLGDEAVVVYKVTAEYEPALDAGVRWDDPTLAVSWPLAEPVISERDRALPAWSAESEG